MKVIGAYVDEVRIFGKWLRKPGAICGVPGLLQFGNNFRDHPLVTTIHGLLLIDASRFRTPDDLTRSMRAPT